MCDLGPQYVRIKNCTANCPYQEQQLCGFFIEFKVKFLKTKLITLQVCFNDTKFIVVYMSIRLVEYLPLLGIVSQNMPYLGLLWS